MRQDRAHLGRRDRRGARGPARPAELASAPPPSAPTAPASSPPSYDKTARIWDAATGKAARGAARARGLGGLRRFQPRRKAHRHRVIGQDRAGLGAATGKEIAVLRGHDDQVNSAAFSRDGSRIVTASYDKTARLWDAATGKEIAVLAGHEAEVISAAFSPDGSRIVTASGDQTARIWDAATGKESAVLRGHDRPGELGGLQPRRLPHRHRVIGPDCPHLGCRDRQGARDPARP